MTWCAYVLPSWMGILLPNGNDRKPCGVHGQEKMRGGEFGVVPCRDGRITLIGIPEGDYTLEIHVPDLRAETLPVLKVRPKDVLDSGVSASMRRVPSRAVSEP